MTREILAARRELDAFDFEWSGVSYHVTVGRFLDGSIAEVFLNAGKPGSGVNIMAKDAAVVFSLARQFGVPLDVILKALSQELNGQHIGPLGVALRLADSPNRAETLLKLVQP